MSIQNVVTIPAPVIGHLMLELGRRGSGWMAVCRGGAYLRGGSCELLHRSVSFTRNLVQELSAPAENEGFPVVVWCNPGSPDRAAAERCMDALAKLSIGLGAFLWIQADTSSVSAHGWIKRGGDLAAIDALAMPGAQMQRLAVRPLLPSQPAPRGAPAPRQPPTTAVQPARRPPPEEWRERLKRLAVFLGEGDAARGYRILETGRARRVCVVAVGRLGSELVAALCAAGVGAEGWLVLIDGDEIENVNRDVMQVPPGAVGMKKPVAVAAMQKVLRPDVRVSTVCGTLSDAEALEAVIASDIIFACVDVDAPRPALGGVAARYNRVLFDAAGGAAYLPGGGISAGGEIRISLPCSDYGCSACFLGLSRESAVSGLTASREAERDERLRTNPDGQRPGSCGAIIRHVVGELERQFWRLLQGKLRESVWLHLDANETVAQWSVRQPAIRPARCWACSARGLRGRGDGSFAHE